MKTVKSTIREKAMKSAAEMVIVAKNYFRRNDVVMGKQTIKGIEGLAGLNRSDIKMFTAQARS